MSSHILWPQNFMIENEFSSEGFLASSLLATLTLDDETKRYLWFFATTNRRNSTIKQVKML